jgi:hypothetical protein
MHKHKQHDIKLKHKQLKTKQVIAQNQQYTK